MAATQRSDKDGAWCVDFRYRGRRIRRRSPVQTRRGAEQFERLLRAELLRREELHGVPFLGPPPTYARFAEIWLEQRARPVNRPSTYEKKCIVVRRHLLPAFGALPIHGITEERIVAFVGSLRERKLKAKSIVNIQSILRSSLAAAYRSGYIRGVPSFPKIDVPEPSFSYLSTEDARKLVAATRPGYFRALVLFLLHTGCRFGEAAALRWEDVTLDLGSPRVRISRSAWRGEPAPTKNGRCRTIPLSPELRTELAAFRATTTSPFVFALGSAAISGRGSAPFGGRCGLGVAGFAFFGVFEEGIVGLQIVGFDDDVVGVLVAGDDGLPSGHRSGHQPARECVATFWSSAPRTHRLNPIVK